MCDDNHPDDEILEQYAMAKLTQGAVEPIEEHIVICAFCQDRLDFTETYLRGMKGALASDAKCRLAARLEKAKVRKPLLTRTASGRYF